MLDMQSYSAMVEANGCTSPTLYADVFRSKLLLLYKEQNLLTFTRCSNLIKLKVRLENSTQEKKLSDFSGLYYKTYYSRNLQISVIS